MRTIRQLLQKTRSPSFSNVTHTCAIVMLLISSLGHYCCLEWFGCTSFLWYISGICCLSAFMSLSHRDHFQSCFWSFLTYVSDVDYTHLKIAWRILPWLWMSLRTMYDLLLERLNKNNHPFTCVKCWYCGFFFHDSSTCPSLFIGNCSFYRAKQLSNGLTHPSIVSDLPVFLFISHTISSISTTVIR